MTSRTVTVIGCGRLGQRIIGCLAGHGLTVIAYDRNSDALRSIASVVATDAEVLMRDGLIQNTDFISNIRTAPTLSEAVRDATLVIEAVFDDLALKTSIFREVAAACGENTILTTNSLNLKVDDIFADVSNPGRCCGMRFLFPVYFIPEVEIFRTRHTSMDTMDKLQSFLESIGKTLYFRHSLAMPLVLNVEQVDERRYAAQLRGSCFSRAPAFTGFPTGSATAWAMQRSAAGYQSNAIAIANQNALYGNMLPASETNDQTPSSDRSYRPPYLPSCGSDASSVNSSLNATTTTNLSTIVNVPAQQECVICCDAPRDCTFVPCGHIAVCHPCAQVLHFRREPCPICRNVIQSVMRVYSP